MLRLKNPLIALAIVALIGVAACSSSASVGQPAPPNVAPGGPTTGRDTSGGGTTKDATGSESGGTPTGGADGVITQDPTGPLVVRTGSLSLEVNELDNTILQARARIVGLGGYVSDSERSNSGDRATALITYRIPASHWDEALDALHGLGIKVLSEQTRAVEVTGQVLDLGARIDNLRATERALQAIMTQATKIADILEVQNQLSAVQGQIEQLTTQKAHLGDQAALGTLAVTYQLPVVALAQVNSGWNLSAEVDRAVAQLVQVGQGLVVAGVWLGVVVLPIVLGLLLIVGLAIFAARKLGLTRRPDVPAMPTGA